MKQRSRSGFVLAAVTAMTAFAVAACSSSGAASSAGAPNATTAASAAAGGTSLASLVPGSIRSAGVVQVATPGNTPPEEYTDSSGNMVGYEVDLVKAVAAELGLTPQFTTTPFASIIPGLQAERYDLAVGQFGIDTAREKVVDMVSIASLTEAFGVMKSSGISSLTQAALCGHSVSIITGSNEQTLATDQSTECTSSGRQPVTIHAFPDNGSAWLAVQSGRAQVYWSGSTAVGYTVRNSKVPAAVVGTDLAPSLTGILVRPGSGLGPAVLKAMQQLIASGQYATIMSKYGVAGAEIKTSQLNPAIAAS
jgi:polar amino acid transport system substrate-binding protein